MNELESKLFDLEECLMRNDDMVDGSTYSTIVGIANEVSELESKNARLQEQIKQFQAENARLRELFYEAWDWMRHVRYDKYIRMEKLCDESDGYVEKEES